MSHSGRVRLQSRDKAGGGFEVLRVQSNGECGKEVKKQAGWNGWRKVSAVIKEDQRE